MKGYFSCSLRFFFEKVRQLPKPVSPALHVGKAVHEGLRARNDYVAVQRPIADWSGDLKRANTPPWIEASVEVNVNVYLICDLYCKSGPQRRETTGSVPLRQR
jgi:hypothetical protein